MSQSKIMSLMEALTNTGVGLIIAWFAQTWFLHIMDVNITHQQNFALVMFMTVVSILRSYFLRRLFNKG